MPRPAPSGRARREVSAGGELTALREIAEETGLPLSGLRIVAQLPAVKYAKCSMPGSRASRPAR